VRKLTGDVELWLLPNGHWSGSVDLGQHPTGWAPAGIGDFNHDGNADIWRDAAGTHVEGWLLSKYVRLAAQDSRARRL
jgi:hypothetical protein